MMIGDEPEDGNWGKQFGIRHGKIVIDRPTEGSDAISENIRLGLITGADNLLDALASAQTDHHLVGLVRKLRKDLEDDPGPIELGLTSVTLISVIEAFARELPMAINAQLFAYSAQLTRHVLSSANWLTFMENARKAGLESPDVAVVADHIVQEISEATTVVAVGVSEEILTTRAMVELAGAHSSYVRFELIFSLSNFISKVFKQAKKPARRQDQYQALGVKLSPAARSLMNILKSEISGHSARSNIYHPAVEMLNTAIETIGGFVMTGLETIGLVASVIEIFEFLRKAGENVSKDAAWKVFNQRKAEGRRLELSLDPTKDQFDDTVAETLEMEASSPDFMRRIQEICLKAYVTAGEDINTTDLQIIRMRAGSCVCLNLKMMLRDSGFEFPNVTARKWWEQFECTS